MFSGNMNAGDCSITIRHIHREDQNTYQLQTLEQGQRSWVTRATINITVHTVPETPVLSDPGPVTVGQQVVLNCSLRVHCPSDQPRLRWRWERGPQNGSSVHGDTDLHQDGQQMMVLWTSLSFTVPKNINPRVRCEAEYPENRRSAATREILVHFPPRDVLVEVVTLSVRAGGNPLLSCHCKADPPVSQYQWWIVDSGLAPVLLPKHTHSVRIYNVSRNTHVQCIVSNRLGRASSRLTALNVQYAPLIDSSSSRCVWDGLLLSCWCVVHSNPRPAVTWSVNGTQPPDGFNTSSSSVNQTLTATLSGATHTLLHVHCYTFNALGNSSILLLQRNQSDLLWTVLPCVCAGTLALMMLILLCYCRSSRRRRRVASLQPMSVCVYQRRRPLYINCSEVTHIYSNGSYQLIYQNSTPLFVHSKQTHKRQRRGAQHQRVQRLTAVTSDPETAIYLEVI